MKKLSPKFATSKAERISFDAEKVYFFWNECRKTLGFAF
jgi:hypothetical protein